MNTSPARVNFTDGSSIKLDRNNTKVSVIQSNGEPMPQTLATVSTQNLVILHENTRKSVSHIVNL